MGVGVGVLVSLATGAQATAPTTKSRAPIVGRNTRNTELSSLQLSTELLYWVFLRCILVKLSFKVNYRSLDYNFFLPLKENFALSIIRLTRSGRSPADCRKGDKLMTSVRDWTKEFVRRTSEALEEPLWLIAVVATFVVGVSSFREGNLLLGLLFTAVVLPLVVGMELAWWYIYHDRVLD